MNIFKNFIAHNKDKKELKIAIEDLVKESTLTPRFIVYSALSSALAALGILMNNIPILIGAMVVAPLLIPILSLSVGLGAGSIKLIYHSLKSLIVGFIISLGIAAFISWLYKPDFIEIVYYASFGNQDLYAIVAVLSGILAAYSWFNTTKSNIIPAVGVAVSLVPPLAFTGIIIPAKNQAFLIDVTQLLYINLAGIVIGALFTFLIIRFFHTQPNQEVDKEVEKGVEKHEKANGKNS